MNNDRCMRLQIYKLFLIWGQKYLQRLHCHVSPTVFLWLSYGLSTAFLRIFNGRKSMISNAAAEGGPRRVRRGSVGALFKLLAASVLLFAVFYDDFDVGVARAEGLGELFGAVDGAVLAAGASEADGEVGEVALEVFVDAL